MKHLTHELRSAHRGAPRHGGSRNILRKVPVPALIPSFFVIGSGQYRIVCDDSLPDLERLDALANSCNNSDNLMACQRVSLDPRRVVSLNHVGDIANIGTTPAGDTQYEI